MDEKQDAVDRLQIFGARLEALADEQVRKRAQIEDRWLEDLRQYHGQNPPDEESALAKGRKSRVFVNITRNKTTSGEARLADLLFPTDDRNWGIKPTPIPELDELKHDDEIVETEEGPQRVGDGVRAVLEEARKRAERMSKEIDDQLTEAQYNAVCRDMIHDACVLGTGILKAPVVVGRTRKKWLREEGVSVLQIVEDLRPGVERVDPWNFFPDMSAAHVSEAEFVFERKMVSKQQLRDLAKRPGFIAEQISKVIESDDSGPKTYGRVQDLRHITGVDVPDQDSRYEMWEYHGPINKNDLEAAGVDIGDDPMQEMHGVVTMCAGVVLKVSLNPLETNELPYSVFCWEYDPTYIFGFGIPYLMRSSQKVINAAWRMILDNAALSTGPQIVVNREVVEPADGNWNMTARKVWYLNNKQHDVRQAFASHEISSHQGELVDIFMRARQLADEETNLPLIAQGEQTDNITQTAQGMSILMSAADVTIRRIVKAFDDDITAPVITRFYDYNMQYGEKDEIKGDFEVQAMGSSYLAEKAAMEQGVQQLLQFAAHPVFGPMTDARALYRKAVKGLRVDPDEVMAEEDPNQPDPQALAAQAQQQAAEAEMQIKQAELQLKQQEVQGRQQLDAQKIASEREVAMMKLALEQDITMAQLQAKLQLEGRKVESHREIEGVKAMNHQNELAFKARTGRQGI
jgi:hypothetical protein